jgi:phosphoribosylanthranilate isomerase
MIVKICGIRSLGDALAAVDAGADMLGFNFYAASPRYLENIACERLVQSLRAAIPRPPLLVGVFVNAPVSEIVAVLDRCTLDMAQLHGDEPPAAVAGLGGRAFKAVRPATPEAAAEQVRTYRQQASPLGAPEILLDASAPGLYGGSGLTADWSVAAEQAREARLLLAGGLNPANVAKAVAMVRPWGVDVASGVEIEPGTKDAAKMRVFVEQARRAEPN